MQAKERTFKHLTKNDRLRMERWLNKGMKPREIADKLRVHISTVYRELKRGEYERLDGDTWEMVTAYSPDIAEERYQNHLREKGPDLKIGTDHELARYIEETIIANDCSPAAVLGYAKMEGRAFKTSVSVATIYSYIKKRDIPAYHTGGFAAAREEKAGVQKGKDKERPGQGVRR